jgi:RNA polymerase sigma-70 factor, ECF subfamily
MKIVITESQYSKLINKSLDFNTIYKLYYPTMYREVCLRYSNGNTDMADEYCQLGFIKVNEKLDKYENKGNIEGWVRKVISNTVLDELRKQKRIPREIEVDFGITDLSDEEPEDELFTLSDIKKAIDNLPPMMKKTFEMYYLDDMSHLDIANELGISDGTSKSNLFKAKAKVKSYLQDLNKKRED